jgi:uncharacterized caspase-like protein/predicted Zn-dependent protease
VLQYPELVDHWAVVVGISKYKHDTLRLRHAHRDANQLYDWLLTPAAGGGFSSERIVKLIDEEATTSNITRALRSFLQRPAPEDVVLLYFACHGGPDPKRPSNIYLLTHDTDPADIAGTALPMREIDLALRENLSAERVVIIADTCHSAAIGANRRSIVGSAAVNQYLQELSRSKPGTALLTSAEANETAQEGDWGGGHGVFTHFLLEGLRGAADRAPIDGVVTVGELFEYVREAVREATHNDQHPSIGLSVFDRRLPLAVSGDTSVQEHLELGRCLYEFARHLNDPRLLDAAGRRLREAHRLSVARRADIQTQMGKVVLAQARAEEAVRAFREAVEVDGSQADAWYYLAILERTVRNSTGTQAAHPVFSARFPNDPRVDFVTRWVADPEAGGRNRAIVVGIDAYSTMPDISNQSVFAGGFSKNDATQIQKALTRLRFEERDIELLIDGAATKRGLLDSLRRIAATSDRTATFVLYYSGLGFDPGGAGLIVHDSAMDVTATGMSGRTDTLISLRELHEAMRMVPAWHKVLIIDGPIDGALEQLALTGGYVVFSGASANERAFITTAHGAFTGALLEELASAAPAVTSLRELRERVSERMSATSVTQHPIVWGDATRRLVQPRSRLDLAFELAEARYYEHYSIGTLEDMLAWAERDNRYPPDLRFSLARAFLRRGDRQRALRILKTQPSIPDSDAEGVFLLALVHLLDDRPAAARTAFGRLVGATTEWSPLLNQEIARVLLALGEYDTAVAMCMRCLAAPRGQRWEARAILGVAQVLKDKESASDALTACWNERPKTSEDGLLQHVVRFLVTGSGPPKRHAILVGISAYPMVALDMARGEAERLRDVLVDHLDFEADNVTVLLDQDATRDAIVAAFEHATTAVYPFESFLFFFSGHCTYDPHGPEPPDGYRDLYYPIDGVSTEGPVERQAISGLQLHEMLSRISAADKTVILDAGGPEMTRLAGDKGDYLLLTSASAGQTTMDGVFASRLVNELRSSHPGSLSAGALIDAVASRMGPSEGGHAKGTYPGEGDASRQTPRLIGERAAVLFQPKPARTLAERVAAARTMIERGLDPVAIGDGLLRYEYTFSDHAVQTLTRSLRMRPEDRPETYLHLGIAFVLQGDYPRATDALRTAIAQSPDQHCPKAHYYLGRILFEAGSDYDQAVAELRLSVRQDPTDPHANFYLAHAIRAQVQRRSLVEAAAAYRAYAAAGSPLGTDLDLVAFALPTHQTLQGAAGQTGIPHKTQTGFGDAGGQGASTKT